MEIRSKIPKLYHYRIRGAFAFPSKVCYLFNYRFLLGARLHFAETTL